MLLLLLLLLLLLVVVVVVVMYMSKATHKPHGGHSLLSNLRRSIATPGRVTYVYVRIHIYIYIYIERERYVMYYRMLRTISYIVCNVTGDILHVLYDMVYIML